MGLWEALPFGGPDPPCACSGGWAGCCARPRPMVWCLDRFTWEPVSLGLTLKTARLPKVVDQRTTSAPQEWRSPSVRAASTRLDRPSNRSPSGDSFPRRSGFLRRAGARRDLGWATPCSTTLSEQPSGRRAASTGPGGRRNIACCCCPFPQPAKCLSGAHPGGSAAELQPSALGLRVIVAGRAQAAFESPRPLLASGWRRGEVVPAASGGRACGRSPLPPPTLALTKFRDCEFGAGPAAGCPSGRYRVSRTKQPGPAHHLLHFRSVESSHLP